MSTEDGTITLPEITIVGDPGGRPKTEGDFWCDGYVFGWSNPKAPLERPPMLADEYAQAYLDGAVAGQREASDAVAQADDQTPAEGPSIGPAPEGPVVSYEEAERRWREAWEEFIH